MDSFEFANNATGAIADALSISDTAVVLDTGQGNLFPVIVAGYIFSATLSNSTGTLREIVRVTARVGDAMTVERAQEGTAAMAWPAGSFFQQLPTKGQFDNFIQWTLLGVPSAQLDLGGGGGTAAIDLETLGFHAGAPTVLISMTASAPIELSDITGISLGLTVILSVEEGSSDISIPLDTPPFLLSNISGDVGWPGFPLSSITLFYNPFNDVYKWVEQARTSRAS